MESALQAGPARPQRPRALDATTMCEAFQLTAAERAGQVALRTLGDEVSLTFAEYADWVRRYAAGLHALGVGRGDTVGLMLANRPEFDVLDTAAMHLGACPFSIYNTSSAEQIAYVLANAGCRVAVVQASLLERMQAAIATTATVEHLIVVDAAPPDAITLAELDELGARAEFDFDAAWRSVSPGDLLTLIYTSGTTGPPKGAQLTHANELAQCRGLDEVLPLRSAHGALISFLPTAHIADRGLAHYGQMIWGDTVTTCPDPAQVFAHVADARPTRFGAVPRVWEKLKAALEARMSSEPEEPRRTVILGALEAGLRRVRAEQAGEPVGEELRDRCRQDDTQVFAPLRASLGFDRCASYLIGAAPAPLEVFEFFAAIGIPICEVWGMSELSSIATVVPPGGLRFGTVGTPLPGIEIRLAQDGELLVRGPTLMTGYRNEPVKTAEAIDADGWLHSGDIATEDADGYLRIVDRKKELIINAAGKNMSPANIEQQLKQGSSLIGQAITIGDRRPYNVALIVLDPDASSAFAAHHGLADAGPEAMATEPAVLAEVTAGVRRANDGLSRVEQIKRFRVLPCDWPPAGDELTPTMKLKRRPIAEKYAAEIAALYRD